METNQTAPVQEQTIEIFTAEQLAILPQETKDSIVYLEKYLPANELRILNPLVGELIKIKKLETIQYVKNDKESVDNYKDAKKQITAIKKIAAEAKKTIKGPLDEMGKQVLAIEKGVKSIADGVLAILETTFDEYEKEVEAKRKAAQERKDKKHTDNIEKLTKEQQDLKDHNEKVTVINEIKHEKSSAIEKKVNDAINTFSKKALENLLTETQQYDITSIYTGFRKDVKHLIEKGVITDNEFIDACTIYQEKIRNLITRINDKIEFWKLQETNTTLETTNNTISNFGSFGVGAPVTEGLFETPLKTIQDPNAVANDIEVVLEQENVIISSDLSPNNVQSLPSHPDLTQELNYILSQSVDAIPVYGFTGETENVAEIAKALKSKLNLLKLQYDVIYRTLKMNPAANAQTNDMTVLSAELILIDKIEVYVNNKYNPEQ